jgi:molybdopterin converting factor subunit 1
VQLKVLFFASLRDIAGIAEKHVDVDPGSTVSSLWTRLASDFESPPFKVLCAVNQEYVDDQYAFSENDREVAFFPPVTGG